MCRSVQEARALVLHFRLFFRMRLHLAALVLVNAQLDLLSADKLFESLFGGRAPPFKTRSIHALVLSLFYYLLILIAETGYFPGVLEFEAVLLFLFRKLPTDSVVNLDFL